VVPRIVVSASAAADRTGCSEHRRTSLWIVRALHRSTGRNEHCGNDQRNDTPHCILLFDIEAGISGRRPRTNTPLQALTLLNDPAFFEAAIGLARRVMREVGGAPVDLANHAFRLVHARFPEARELEVLLGLFETELERYRADPPAALALTVLPVPVPQDQELRRSGAMPLADAHPEELAAWTVVANVLLNTDEFVTRE